MPNKKSFWQSEHAGRFYQLENAEREILHPYIAEIVNRRRPATLLDYGCGDGFLSTLIHPDTRVDLFDSSPEFEKYLVPGAKEKRVLIIRSRDQIPSDYYDCVVQSSVVMCCESKDVLRKMFEDNCKSLKRKATLIVCLTHPCFLQYEFGHYSTSLAHENFDYLSEGGTYRVFMNVADGEPVVFTDYHWPLSTVINLILRSGFKITRFVEHPDLPFGSNSHNEFAVPWLIVVAEKRY